MKKITFVKQLSFFIALFCAVNFGFGQICNISDNFNRADNTVIGGNWTKVGTASITSNQLVIGTGSTIGRDYVYQNVSSFYNTQLSSLPSSIQWTFNMRQSRLNPSGFDSNEYGVAFILGGTNSNLTLGNGYAVVLGENSGADKVRLVSYTGGVVLNSSLTNVIAGTNTYGAEYLSIKVIYTPTTNTWQLYVRNDATTPSVDPTTLNATHLRGTAVNSTFTSSNLNFVGMLWNHHNGPSEIATFDNVCIYTAPCADNTTWNGSWSNGLPNSLTKSVTISSNYNTSSGNITACSLTVTNNAVLNITNNTFAEVQNSIVVDAGSTFLVQPYGAVVQIDNAGTVTNNGTMSVTKTTAPMAVALEYTYWSSPVFGETIGQGLSESNAGRRFSFNALNFLDATAETGNNGATVPGQDDIDDNGDDWEWVSGSTIMQPGVGYASTHDPSVFPFPNVGYDYTFDGRFNTGTIPVNVYRNDGSIADKNWNFIGNPYPSAISASSFFTQNRYVAVTNTAGTLEGAIYYWSQNSPPSSSNNGNQGYNFATSDYATENGTGGAAGGDGVAPTGFIPSGQGFFVSFSQARPTSTGTVIFNNAMRVKGATNNSQFFKNTNTKGKTNIAENKLWINLTSDNGVFNQILTGYVNGATNDDDGMYYDADKNLSAGTYASLYTLIDNCTKKFAIQGKDANSLNENESFNLGFKTSIDVATLYKLSVAQLEGSFLTGNTIYLRDHLLNTEHNLSASDYTFTSEVGEFNSRFTIAFTAKALSTNAFNLNENTVKIASLDNNHVSFKASNNLNINTVSIYDMLGRELYTFKGNNNEETYRLSNLNNTVIIAKIALSNGAVITKKAIIK